MTEDKAKRAKAKRAKAKREVKVDITEPQTPTMSARDAWKRLQNEVVEELSAAVRRQPAKDQKLLKGFLEIADFMLKNTTGIGSNIHLAECRLADLGKPEIRQYYTLVLALLAFHLGCLLPAQAQGVWEAVRQVTGDAETCEVFARELEACKDHEDGTFSQVRAGRKLWERAARLLGVPDAEKNVPGRFYYQTAPGQDLIFILENQAPR